MDVELIDQKGNDILAAAEPPAADVAALPRENPAEATRRWRRDGIAEQVAAFRDRVRTDYLADHPGCRRRDAHDYAWARALAEFPPGAGPHIPEPPVVVAEPPAAPATPPAATESGLAGLGELPPSWPSLPANAALAVEVAWVQANRLRVVQGGAVDLTRSLSPAPSYAALAWLETSMLFPSKWADVTVKATQDAQDDQADVRRERVALAEVRALMAEAAAAGT